MAYRALPEALPLEDSKFPTHDLAVFLRTTGPRDRASRVDTPDAKKRSKSLPREIIRKLLPKSTGNQLLGFSDEDR
jgi:hypothetical protein